MPPQEMGILNGPEFLDSNLELMTLCPKASADFHISQCASAVSHVNIFTRPIFLFVPSEITNQWQLMLLI